MATFPGVITEQGQSIEGGLVLLTVSDRNARDGFANTYPLVVDDVVASQLGDTTPPDVVDVVLSDPIYEDYEFIDNHCELAQNKLPQQFRDKPKFLDFVCIWADRMQAIEQQLANILLGRSIAGSVGQQMDELGDLMSVARNGLSDANYRVRLAARAAVIGSRGTAPEIIAIAQTLDNGSDPGSIVFEQDFPASFKVYMTVPAGKQLWGEQFAADFIKPAAAAGVLGKIYFTERDTRIFTWAASADDPTPGFLTGWEEEAGPVGGGGTWAEVV